MRALNSTTNSSSFSISGKLRLSVFSVLVFFWGMGVCGQQVIGTYPLINGGIEGATVDNTVFSSAQANKWVKNNASQTISSENSVVRSGSTSISINNGTTGRRVWSPLVSVSSTTSSVTIQYYRRVTSTTDTQENQSGIGNGTTTTEAATGTYNVPASANTWEKVTYTRTSSTFTDIAAVLLTRQKGTGGLMYCDDMVLYNGGVDNTAPNSPGTVAISNATSNSLDIAWVAASGGVDGGGYVVVRYSSNPNADNDPNQNGIYAVGNTTTNGTSSLTGTIRYIGTGTSFTDNVGLSSSTQYWYKVYTVDKAFNYSNESSGSGTTSSSSPTITGAATATAFTTTYGTPSTAQTFSISGSNLTADITATAPTGFEVSSDGTNYGGTATFTQTSGSASGSLRIRLKANAAVGGTYNSQNIVLSSTGATSVNITTAASGNAVTTKGLTISGLTASSKDWDGTSSVSVTGTAAYTGLVNSESFSVTGSVSWMFPNSNVGNNITLTRIGSFDAPSANYTVTQPTLTASIIALSSPTISAAANVTVDNPFAVTFTENASWRGAITSITIGGTTLDAGAYSTTTAGQITFTPSASVLLQSSGSKSIVVNATGYTNATVNQSIGAGVANKLAINTQPAAPATNGAVLATQPVVVIQDQYGNATTSTASVSASVGSGTWTLGGVSSLSAVSGTVTFSGLTATSAALVTGATISFSSTGLTGATSGPFNIVAPAPANDLCVNSTVIGIDGTVVNGTFSSSTIDAGFSTSAVGDVWYRINSNCTGSVSITSNGNSYNIGIYSWTSSCPSSNTGYNSVGTGNSLNPSGSISVVAGSVYYIRIASFSSSASAFSFTPSLTAVSQAVTTSSATTITGTGATLNGNVTAIGNCPPTNSKGFVYAINSSNSAPEVSGIGTTQVNITNNITSGSYSSNLTGLNTGETYAFRAFVYDGTTYTYGSVLTFTTLANPSLAVTGTTSHGSVCPGAAATAVTYTITNTGSTASNVVVSSSDAQFVVGNLSSTTIAANGTATYQVTFTPSSSGSKSATVTVYYDNTTQATTSSLTGTGIASVTGVVSSAAATIITTTTATLNGSLSTLGVCPATTQKGFVYSLTSVNADPEDGGTGVLSSPVSGLSTGAYSLALNGLTAASGYTFKAYIFDGTNYIYGIATSFTTLETQPSVLATTLAIGNSTLGSLDVSWTSGNGSNRIVVARLSSTTRVLPTNATNYMVNNNAFNNGSNPITGAGNVVVYNGTGSSVTVTGLNNATVYAFDVYEYNGTGTTTNYATFLTGSKTSLASEPTVQASNVTFSNVSSTGFTINWTKGTGSDNSLVVVKSGSAVDATLLDAVSYSAGGSFGTGTQIGTANYVVYRATLGTVNITGLSDGTTYHVAVYAYNGTAGQGFENYLVNSPATGSQTAQTPTFYSKGSLDPGLLTSWSANMDGSGDSPTSFTANAANFIIQNGHLMTTTSAFSLGTTGSKLQISTGGVLSAGHAITLTANSTFQIDNGGKYSQTATFTMSSTIFAGIESFASNSTVEYLVNPTASAPSNGYGNVIINVTSGTGNFGWGGALNTVQGDLTILGTGSGTARHALTAGTNISLTIGGNLNISGGNFWLTSGAGNCTVNLSGNLIVNGGTLDLGSSSGVGVINVAGNVSLMSGTLTETGSSTTSKIVFNKNGEQTFTSGSTISNTVNFEIGSNSILNLGVSVISGAGSVTVTNGGTVKVGSLSTTDAIAGNITATGGLILNSGALVEFCGSGLQYTSSRTFSLLKINNSNGVNLVTGANDITVNGTLYLQNGNITTGNSKVILSSAANVVRTSGHVVGNLQKNIPLGAANVSFEVGGAAVYRPIVLSFGNVTVSGNLIVSCSQTDGLHPNVNSSTLSQIKYVKRYWSILNNGVSFNNYSATLNFVTADIVNNGSATALIAGVYNNGWSYPTVLSAGSNSNTINGITSFGDVVLAEQCNAPSITSQPSVNQAVCQNTSSNIVISASGDGLSYQWYSNTVNSNSGGTSLSSTNGAQTVTLAPSTNSSGTIYYYCMVTGHCGNSTSNVSSLVVNSTPSAPTAIATQNFCTSNNPTINSLGATGSNILWYDAATAGNLMSGSAVLTSATYYASQTVSGCESSTRAQVVANTVGSGLWIGGNGNWSTAANWCGNSVPNAAASNATVSDAVTVHIDASLELNALTIGALASVIVDPNIALTLNSTLTNNGTFILQDGATFKQANSGTSISGDGTFTVEKALAGNSSTWNATSGRFWYMGVPMNSVARSSFGNYTAGSNRVWSYNEVSKLYTDITTDATTLAAGTGYVHRRSADGTLTFSATGANGLYRIDQNLTGLTRTSGSSVGFHLIANPYMAYLDWDAVIRTNVEPTYYLRSHNNTANDISALITYNALTGLESNNSSISNSVDFSYLAPMQAIWIRVGPNTGTGSLSMDRSMLSHQTGNPGLKNSTIFPTLARVNLVDGARFDQMLVFMNQDMTNGVDQYDSEKMFVSGAPQLYTMAAGKKLVMNGLKNNKKKISVPLYLELPLSKVYQLQLADYNLEDGLILLEDKQEGTIQDFTIHDTYAFYANSGVLQNRFVLHFYAPDATITAQGPSNTWVAEEGSYTEGGNIAISSDAKGKVQISLDQPETDRVEGTVQVTDANGRIVHSGALEGLTTEFQLDVPAGIYYLTVQSGNLIENKKVYIQE